MVNRVPTVGPLATCRRRQAHAYGQQLDRQTQRIVRGLSQRIEKELKLRAVVPEHASIWPG